jgi:hypothetical protein
MSRGQRQQAYLQGWNDLDTSERGMTCGFVQLGGKKAQRGLGRSP